MLSTLVQCLVEYLLEYPMEYPVEYPVDFPMKDGVYNTDNLDRNAKDIKVENWDTRQDW
jgi:hypothetical protein